MPRQMIQWLSDCTLASPPTHQSPYTMHLAPSPRSTLSEKKTKQKLYYSQIYWVIYMYVCSCVCVFVCVQRGKAVSIFGLAHISACKLGGFFISFLRKFRFSYTLLKYFEWDTRKVSKI